MVDERLIPVYALNIAATPHPAGIYIKLLTRAATFFARAHGSDYARISVPKESDRDGVYTGRILIWTEIDLGGKWYDVSADAELSDALRKTISIPENAKPNFRTFDYIFYEKKHRIYFEARNDLGNTVGPSVILRVLRQLLSQDLQGLKAPSVEVTLVPKEGTVARILAMPGLRKLTMRVVLPNPDATDNATLLRVRKRLQDANARQLDETFTKRPGAARLVATQEIKDTAAVAAENGYVRGERTVDGKLVALSTSDEPRREYARADAGASFLSRVLGSIGLF